MLVTENHNEENGKGPSDERGISLEYKVGELINLIKKSKLDEQQANSIKTRINAALTASYQIDIVAFKQMDNKNGASRTELLDNLDILLSAHTLDSKQSRNYILQKRFKSAITICISLLLILLGFAMIIMPAPPYFEMFTIFYFNRNDGVTLMDLISLLVVFTGIYLLISSILRIRNAIS